jgi:hypothetical protein
VACFAEPVGGGRVGKQDPRRYSQDEDGAGKGEQHRADERAAMTERISTDLDLSRLQQPADAALHPLHRYPLTGW